MSFRYDKYNLIKEHTTLSERKKLWITGRNTLVVSLPREWGEKGEEVELTSIGNMIILRKELLEEAIESKYQEPLQLKYDLMNAYLQGYREFRVAIPEGNTRKIDEVKLLSRDASIYGIDYKELPPNKVVFSFPAGGTNIHELLNKLFDWDGMVYSLVLKHMDNPLPVKETELEDTYRKIRDVEKDADAITSYTKRLLGQAQSNPGLIKSIGLENSLQAISYITIAENLERVIDHQHDLFHGIMNLNRFINKEKKVVEFDFSDEDQYGFKEYYIDAHTFLEKACKNIKSFDKKEILSILATKETYILHNIYGRLGYRSLPSQELITPEKRRKIFKLMESGPHSVILAGMQTKIWGLTGVATNIAEAALNLRRPT